MSKFKEKLIPQVRDAIHPREGACGICHAVAEEICSAGGRIVAYERPGGILSHIFDDQGKLVAGLSVSAPADRLEESWAERVKATAAQISGSLGHRQG